MALSQPIKVDQLNMEGNAVADAVTVASAGTSAVAPEGTEYISMWCDVASTIEANILGRDPTNIPAGEVIFNAKEYKIPAGVVFQIPNIIPGVTTITVTDI